MQMARMLSTLTLAAMLGGSGGDRAAQGASARGWGAVRQAGAAAVSLPPFALFGWVSPPNDSTTEARIAELAGAGFNVALPAWADSGRLADNLRRIRLAAKHGVRCLAWDERFDLVYNQGAGTALLDTIVADYANEPGFLGYYFTDEPQPPDFPLLSRIYADLRARDPVHPAWDNLLGTATFTTREDWEQYVRPFIEAVGPSVLCDDSYDFLLDHDRGRYVENIAALRAVSDEYGIPFWNFVLLIQHGPYRAITRGELRWQVSENLAYGARGIGFFTYWTPAPDPAQNWGPAVITYDGKRTPWYDFLAGWNPGVRAAGETLAGLTWLSTQHAGSVPMGAAAFAPDGWIRAVEGRAAIGRFAGASGERYLLIANSDSLAPQTIGLLLPRTRQVWKQAAPAGSWSEVRAVPAELGGSRTSLWLDSGDFVLLRLQPDSGAPGPALALGPNPARAAVRFAVSRIGAGARLEILDPLGRRVWSSTLVPDAGPVTWSGEREGGGRARPGIYFARVTDPGGVTTARFSWLGGR